MNQVEIEIEISKGKKVKYKKGNEQISTWTEFQSTRPIYSSPARPIPNSRAAQLLHQPQLCRHCHMGPSCQQLGARSSHARPPSSRLHVGPLNCGVVFTESRTGRSSTNPAHVGAQWRSYRVVRVGHGIPYGPAHRTTNP